MHCRRPYETGIELPFGEVPKGFFRTVDAGSFAVEHQIHATVAELLREAADLFRLCFCHPVRHDPKGGDAKIVEADYVVEAFHDDEAVFLDEIAVAGFQQAAGLLAEESDASTEAFREPMLCEWFFGGAFRSRQSLVLLFLPFELHIASGPCQDFAVLGEPG